MDERWRRHTCRMDKCHRSTLKYSATSCCVDSCSGIRGYVSQTMDFPKMVPPSSKYLDCVHIRFHANRGREAYEPAHSVLIDGIFTHHVHRMLIYTDAHYS